MVSISYANEPLDRPYRYPTSIGVMGGYGSTTWEGLVPNHENQNDAISISTPQLVKEGGGVWGAFIAHELIPNFALEASYIHYPDARVMFDSLSIFTFEHEGLSEFTTHTEAVNIVGKFLLSLSKTKMRLYSSIGAATVHRSDILYDKWRLNPTFGLGLNFHLSQRIMAEIMASYTAGFGESRLNPTNSYFPFLYAATAKVGYCF